jgi:uncharacterized protein (DUF433 family)
MKPIEVTPDVHFGKPCIAGTRIPVQAVLELIREDIPFPTIIRDYYPELSIGDIQSCVQYAIDLVRNEDVRFAAIA